MINLDLCLTVPNETLIPHSTEPDKGHLYSSCTLTLHLPYTEQSLGVLFISA